MLFFKVMIYVNAASERSERDGYLCSFWSSRTAHVYIALSILEFSWLVIFPFLNTQYAGQRL